MKASQERAKETEFQQQFELPIFACTQQSIVEFTEISIQNKITIHSFLRCCLLYRERVSNMAGRKKKEPLGRSTGRIRDRAHSAGQTLLGLLCSGVVTYGATVGPQPLFVVIMRSTKAQYKP